MANVSLEKRLLVALLLGVFTPAMQARDLRIPLPARSHLTPVQRLNQEGVGAVGKRQYSKASELFYKAYLYDPQDPFTLNNLGYMAELSGDADRAQTFYDLASRQMTDAVIAKASSSKLEGKSFRDEIAGINDPAMRVSRANVHAVRLLSQGRSTEAEAILRDALTIDPHNAFTLNNLGVAKEADGDLESALRYFTDAANTRSANPVVVTFNRTWRGKPVSEAAADSARHVQERIHRETAVERAARMNFRGVQAINRNDRRAAAEDFRVAYSLDPASAFSLNNLGYSSEVDGDPETAEFFYEKAREAEGAAARVGLATGRSAEGMPLFEVASANDQKVAARMAEDVNARRQRPGPVVLKHRDNTPVVETAPPAAPASESSPPSLPTGNPPTPSPNGTQPSNP